MKRLAAGVLLVALTLAVPSRAVSFPDHGLLDAYGRWTIGASRGDVMAGRMMGADATSIIYDQAGHYVGAYVDDTTPAADGGPRTVARRLLGIEGHGLIVMGTTSGARDRGPAPLAGVVSAVEWFAGWGVPPAHWANGQPQHGFILWWDYVPPGSRLPSLQKRQQVLDAIRSRQPHVLWTW